MLCAVTLTLRGVEYLVVTENVNELGGFYRAIGFLTTTEVDEFGEPVRDVIRGANLVAENPLVELEDRRRGYAGTLHGMHNANISTSLFVYLNTFGHGFKDAFFYGEILSKVVDSTGVIIVLTVLVDEVVVGYPEHVVAGQTLTLHFYLDELLEGLYEHNPFEFYGKARDFHTLDDLEVGNRYFLRGVYHATGLLQLVEGLPQVGRGDILALRPLNEVATSLELGIRYERGEEIWFLPVPAGESANLSAPGLEGLADEMELIRLNQSAVLLETTKDMGIVPYLQPTVAIHTIIEGRHLTLDDYQEERAVAVINDFFAETRDVQLGDTLTITVPTAQYLGGGSFITTAHSVVEATQDRFALPAQGEEELLLEVEVVGIYRHRHNIDSSIHANMIYIPDSLIPHDIPTYQSTWEGVMTPLGVLGTDHQSLFWYSFALGDPRDEDRFMLEMRDELAQMGYNVVFIPNQGLEFWSAAEPILQSTGFNFVVFSILVAIILILIVYLYLYQNRKQFAIARALGNTRKSLHVKQLMGMLCLSFPAAIIGSVMGWLFAANEIANTLSPLQDVIDDLEMSMATAAEGGIVPSELDIIININYLFLFTIIILAFILVTVLVFGRLVNRGSVLALLQGETRKRRGNR
jgi:hypothetical protein